MGMKAITDEFEVLFDSLCACQECPLDWEWDADQMCFTATCECMKEHKLRPLNAKLTIPEPEDDEPLDNEPDWD